MLFCDLAGSTELGERLDPESLRALLQRWYEAMRTAVESHGGQVEKFIGDAVMAVFGVPQVHEDDALRAVRAAVEMRDALGRLNTELLAEGRPGLRIRIGINTGEVVTGDGTTTLVTGDAVNTAKRLEEAAASDEILIGATTRRLVANAAELEQADPVAAKGKRDPVEAWRVLVTIAGAAPFARRLDAPLVGRSSELAFLREALDGAIADRGCRLVTVFGVAGIGKSRLAAELLAEVSGHAAVLSGATGAEPATGEERAFLSDHGDLVVRATGSYVGHGPEPQFPMNVALGAVALAHGTIFSPIDSTGIEQPMRGELRQVVITSVGHWRGEGMALLERIG